MSVTLAFYAFEPGTPGEAAERGSAGTRSRWATRRTLWAGFKARAEELGSEVRSGNEMKGWIEEIGRGG